MKGRCFMKDMFLWSSSFWDNYENEEKAKADFGDLIMEHCGYDSEEQIIFSDIIDEFDNMNEINYDEFKDSILYHDKVKRPLDGAFLVVADLGLWDGRHAGGRIIGSLLSVLRECANGCDDIKYEIKNDDLVITGHHHDGVNIYTVKYITPKGFAWAMRNYGNECHRDRECHEHLLNTKGYTRKMFSKYWEFKWGEVM